MWSNWSTLRTQIGRGALARTPAVVHSLEAPEEQTVADVTPARYRAAHLQVRDLHGPARLHPCATGCGRPAAEWAYDGADPAARLGRTARGRLAWFSTDPEHYRPLCRRCHQAADARPVAVAPPPPALAPVQLPSLREAEEPTGVPRRCATCETEKDSAEFCWKDRRRGWRMSRCRSCDAARSAARYVPGSRTYVHDPESQRARYAEHRARAIQVYGGACTWCGATDGLEFDHVNNDGAAHRAMIQTAEWYRKISLAGVPDPDWQLQLLCVPCHRGPGWKDRRATALPA